MYFLPLDPISEIYNPEVTVIATSENMLSLPVACGGPMRTFAECYNANHSLIGIRDPECQSDPMSIDEIVLPEHLERVDGTIRITGHRISLYLVLDGLFGGKTIDDLRRLYPTVPPVKIWKTVHFCNNNFILMREYHQQETFKASRLMAKLDSPNPSSDELRKRREEKKNNGKKT